MRKSAKQRAAPLVPLPGLLKTLGVTIESVLVGTGMSVEDFAPDRMVDFSDFLTVLENAARETGREDFGLLLGREQALGAIGPVADVLRSATTLGQALSDFVALQSVNSTGATAYLHRQGPCVFWGYGFDDPRLSVSPNAHDLVLGVGAHILRDLTGGRVYPVEFSTIRPAPRDAAAWTRLGAPVRFGQTETGLLLPAGAMSFPLPRADPCARDKALGALAVPYRKGQSDWELRTRHALRSLLLEGRSKMPEVARWLGAEPRTLRRALAREGETFETIRASVRLAMARELLSMSSASISDLALTLDFATASAFIHAFRRWTGQTPAEWRRHARCVNEGAMSQASGYQQTGSRNSRSR